MKGNEKKNAVVEIEDEDGRLVIWCVKMKNTNVRHIQGLTIALESHKFPFEIVSPFQKCVKPLNSWLLFFIVEKKWALCFITLKH